MRDGPKAIRKSLLLQKERSRGIWFLAGVHGKDESGEARGFRGERNALRQEAIARVLPAIDHRAASNAI
jgi:hypothetical protein